MREARTLPAWRRPRGCHWRRLAPPISSQAQGLTAENGPVLVLVVQNPSCSSHDTREWILVDVDRQARFLAEQEIQPTNQRPAAGHDDSAIDDVTRQLGRGDLERASHGVDDLLDGLLDRLADLRRVHADG